MAAQAFTVLQEGRHFVIKCGTAIVVKHAERLRSLFALDPAMADRVVMSFTFYVKVFAFRTLVQICYDNTSNYATRFTW